MWREEEQCRALLPRLSRRSTVGSPPVKEPPLLVQPQPITMQSRKKPNYGKIVFVLVAIMVTIAVILTVLNPGHSLPYKYIVTVTNGTIYAKDSSGAILASGSDAAAVIQSALDSLTPSRNTKETVRLQGSFSLAAPIEIPNYAIIELDGTVNLASLSTMASLVITRGVSHVEMSGGVWNGGSISRDPAIAFLGCDDVYLHDMELTSSGGHGGIEAQSCTNVVIANNFVHNTGTTGVSLSGSCSDVRIAHNTISDIPSGGIYAYMAEGGGADVMQRITIDHNNITRVAMAGIALYPDGPEDVFHDSLVEYNTLTDVAWSNSHTMLSIGGGGGGVPSENGLVSDTVVRYNICRETGRYIQGSGNEITIRGERIQLYGNECYNSTHPAIGLVNAYYCEVHDNRVDTTIKGNAAGIEVSGSCYNRIANNLLVNIAGQGVRVIPNGYDDSSYNIIIGNIINPSSSWGNPCVGISSPTPLVNGETAINIANQVLNNIFVGPGESYPSGINDEGTGTIIISNTVM